MDETKRRKTTSKVFPFFFSLFQFILYVHKHATRWYFSSVFMFLLFFIYLGKESIYFVYPLFHSPRWTKSINNNQMENWNYVERKLFAFQRNNFNDHWMWKVYMKRCSCRIGVSENVMHKMNFHFVLAKNILIWCCRSFVHSMVAVVDVRMFHSRSRNRF